MLTISHPNFLFTVSFPSGKRGETMYIGELLCSGLARSVQSLLPWDIPWHDPSHAVFFVAFYGALGAIGMGTMVAMGRTLLNLFKKDSSH